MLSDVEGIKEFNAQIVAAIGMRFVLTSE